MAVATAPPSTSPAAGRLTAVSPQRDRGTAGDDATLTLGQLVGRAWEGLHRPGGVTGVTACPVCTGRMEARAGGAVAECRDCGTRLW